MFWCFANFDSFNNFIIINSLQQSWDWSQPVLLYYKTVCSRPISYLIDKVLKMWNSWIKSI
jgi:hypothetical protein